MSADDLERQVADHYAEEVPLRAPDRVLEDLLASIETTSQRHPLIRVPWRVKIMQTNPRWAVGAVTVAVVGVIGLGVLASGSLSGPGTSSPGAASPQEPTTASAQPSGPVPAAPALDTTFDSRLHGLSVSYPEAWVARPATMPWRTAGLPMFQDATGDVLFDPAYDDHLFLLLASQPLGKASVEQWAGKFGSGQDCGPIQPITIDGAYGFARTECSIAAVTRDGQGYVVLLYTSGDDPELEPLYDASYFADIIDTISLRPAQANQGDPAVRFVRPFSYELPMDVVFDYGPAYGPTYFEVRSPAAAEAGTPSGVIMQAVGGARTDPCDGASGAPSNVVDARGAIDHLATIIGVEVSDPTETTVSGLPGVQATINVADGTTDCPEIWPWADSPESLPSGTPLRMIAVDVAGEIVVFTIYGEATNQAWDTMADAVIDSIRFAR